MITKRYDIRTKHFQCRDFCRVVLMKCFIFLRMFSEAAFVKACTKVRVEMKYVYSIIQYVHYRWHHDQQPVS